MERDISSLPELGNTKKESEVVSQLVSQGRVIGKLKDNLSILESKLQGVLKQEPPVNCCGEQDKECLVPLAETLLNHNSDLYSCLRSIESMIDRLEI